MSTLDHKERNNNKMLHEVYSIKKLFFQPADNGQLNKEIENLQSKILYSSVLTEAHIIALIRGLS